MTSRRFKQFSIASILVLTAAVAVTARFWPKAETVESRVENWAQNHWFDFGVGVVKRIGTSDTWDGYTVVSGQGIHCVLCEGSRIGNTTGGSYYSVNIQLPKRLKTGDVVELVAFPASMTDIRNEIREMEDGTVIAMKFGNPFSWHLAGTSSDSVGKVTIREMNDESVVLDVDLDLKLEREESLTIRQSFTIGRGSPRSPLETERIAR